ncbi:hypothetical protein [Allonocardiopsis opalescens]|uniref:Uncharacterized protein n=1 Tax=Allonocardiopsis opalescens TaxID=1144618 RepID=A0A2T0PPL4_9ACTN|nr:hypothetical protein [Allonocardiopsis opalescens]PRX90845.1 hypothetical protein CLV72_11641 [Allonocardiopsis opalescens]
MTDYAAAVEAAKTLLKAAGASSGLLVLDFDDDGRLDDPAALAEAMRATVETKGLAGRIAVVELVDGSPEAELARELAEERMLTRELADNLDRANARLDGVRAALSPHTAPSRRCGAQVMVGTRVGRCERTAGHPRGQCGFGPK